MANPITPSGFRRDRDIVEEAATQDEERNIRADEEHFRRTGINRRPRRLDNPLVDDNPSPDIANDGDNYDVEDYPIGGEYAEDSPTQFIDSTPSQNSRRQGFSGTLEDVFQRVRARENSRNNGLTEIQQNIRGAFQDYNRQREVDAYNKREKEKEERELEEMKKKRIEQSKNSIMELNIED